jgi:hypothetical protein
MEEEPPRTTSAVQQLRLWQQACKPIVQRYEHTTKFLDTFPTDKEATNVVLDLSATTVAVEITSEIAHLNKVYREEICELGDVAQLVGQGLCIYLIWC